MSTLSNFVSALGRPAAAALAAALIAPVPGALAQANYPSRTITIVAPLAAGGPTDTTARVAADVIAKELNAQTVVENRVGAGGLLAAEHVAKAPPDGYTLLLYTAGTNLLPVVNKNTTIDVVKGFAPISRLIEAPTAVLVNANVPAKNMKEFLAYAKANPGKLNYGVQAASDALVIEAFNSAMGINTVPVRYAGGVPVTQALLSGDVHFSFFFPGTAKAHIDTGKLRLLAVLDDKRFALSPDLPTIVESGGPAFSFVSWFGLVAPAGTPKAITDKISAALAKGMKTGEPATKIKNLGMVVVASSPAEFGKTMAENNARWAAVAKKAGIQPQ